jgi:hypothetical protein
MISGFLIIVRCTIYTCIGIELICDLIMLLRI